LYFWFGAEEEKRQQEVLQFKADMQQQQRNLTEQESRLMSQEARHAATVSAKDEMRARCADLDKHEATLKHEQDNLAASQAQMAEGRHNLQSVWAG
jgi:chromosome segregation ATPase